MTTLSVVIPAYNEENGIADIVKRVLAIAPSLPQAGVDTLELLVVNDGSADKTAQITTELSKTSSNLRLINHSRNRGYGAALKTGFNQAKGELIGFLDADGTYPPEHFPQLCKEALNGSDLVIGSRMAGADSDMPITRKVGNAFFAGLLTLVGRQSVTDSASGMRVFKRQILEQVYPLPDGLNLTPVMSTRAVHERIRMSEIPIPYSERVGNSKLSVVHDGLLFLKSMLWTVLMYNPVRVFGLIGLFGVLISVLAFGGLALARLMGTTTLGPLGVAGLFVASVAGVAGVSVYALGVTFNYLVSLFHNKQEVREQGMFKRSFNLNLNRRFVPIGLTMLIGGSVLGITSLALGLNGWTMERLWLYGLGSAMLMLSGINMLVFGLQLRVIDDLVARDETTERELARLA